MSTRSASIVVRIGSEYARDEEAARRLSDMADATRRAVLDVLAHGLRGDLARSAVGVELGAMLQAGTAADVHAGATPDEILEELRAAADNRPVVYARLLELIVLAGLDEAQLLADLEQGGLQPITPELPPSPPRRSPRRRR